MSKKDPENKNDGSKRIIPPQVSETVRIFRKISQLKFLYFDKELLLQAAPKEVIMQAMDNPDFPSSLCFELKELLFDFNEITNHCNQKIKKLSRIEIEPNGLHVPQAVDIPSELKEKIVSGETDVTALPKDVYEKIVLVTLTEDDYIKSTTGDELDWLSFMIPDGKVFPYTILQENVFSDIGFPVGLYTAGDEDVDPASIKHIYYKDPKTKKVVRGIYFEVTEGPGHLGGGGINGIVVQEGRPIVIINSEKKEAYFINVAESTKDLSGKEHLESRFTVVG